MLKLIIIVLLLCSICAKGASVPDNGIYTYEGTIGKKTKVFVWLTFRDSIAFGEITYKKTGKAIKLRGFPSIDIGNYSINEYASNGDVTGTLFGVIKSDSFIGGWYYPDKNKSLPLRLVYKDTIVVGIDTITKATLVEGSYTYNFPQGPSAFLEILAKGNDSLTFQFNCLSSFVKGGAPNIGEIEETAIKRVTTSFIYLMPESENRCEFEVKFYKDVAWVHYLHDRNECGFGNNANIDGLYLKVK
jgi:hypothetical protein